MYTQFSLIRLKTKNKNQNVSSTKNFGYFIITNYFSFCITTIEQNLHKQLTSHCEVIPKIGAPKK